eukprot:227198-Rhodomonas_salina.1
MTTLRLKWWSTEVRVCPYEPATRRPVLTQCTRYDGRVYGDRRPMGPGPDSQPLVQLLYGLRAR